MFAVYFFVWIVLNDRFDLEVVLFGVPVCALLVLFSRRFLGYPSTGLMGAVRQLPLRAAYLGYLLLEMFRAAIAIMGFVFRPGAEPRPVLVYFDSGLSTDGARAALADSITLTAGTITVDVNGGDFCIHALDGSMAEGIEESGFARRLKELEG